MKKRGFEVVSAFEEGEVKLPVRSTKQAAGFDFHAIEDVVVKPIWVEFFKILSLGVATKLKDFSSSVDKIRPTEVRTGIKAYMQEDEALFMMNRSSNPKERFLVLAEGVGLVDADYYNCEKNEGEILFHFWNFGLKSYRIKKGDRVGQGVFQKILLPDEGKAVFSDYQRKGGHGSTPSKTIE